MPKTEDHAFAQARADHKWWQTVGDLLDLSVTSWTFQETATFHDTKTGRSVTIDGLVARRIIELVEK